MTAQTINKRTNDRSTRGRMYGYIIILSTLMFEIFSYSSSQTALRGWFGDYGINKTLSWANLLAFAFCAADIAIAPVLSRHGGLFGLLGHLVRGTMDAVRFGFLALAVAWIITAFGDTFLTFISVAGNQYARPVPVMVTAGLITADTWYRTVPIFFACLVWLIQYLLVERTDKAAGDIMDGNHATGKSNSTRRSN